MTARDDKDFSKPIINAAADVARKVSADVLFAYVGSVDDLSHVASVVKKPTELILVCRNEDEKKLAAGVDAHAMLVPSFDLTRMGQIKMAALIAFSQGLLKAGNAFVFLSGVSGQQIDTLVTMRVGKEYELFHSVGQPRLTEHIRRPVFERVLRMALELASEGREGKPVGAIFVAGDHREVQKYSDEGRINPFKGYTEKERNIIDESISETVKEIAKLDGAFILKGNGVIVSACAILRPAAAGEIQSQGYGARHAAAAGITACTKSIAITLSESTGAVRVWRRGTMITEIERSAPHVSDGGPPPRISQ